MTLHRRKREIFEKIIKPKFKVGINSDCESSNFSYVHGSHSYSSHHKVNSSSTQKLITDYFRHFKNNHPLKMDDTTNTNRSQDNEVGSGSSQKKRTMGLSDSEYDKLVELVESAFDDKRVLKGSPMTVEWPIIVQKFAEQLGKERPIKILQTAWKKLKEKWRKYHELRHKSGFGWNEETKMLEAEDVVWNSVITKILMAVTATINNCAK